jgi:hypothetical protein
VSRFIQPFCTNSVVPLDLRQDTYPACFTRGDDVPSARKHYAYDVHLQNDRDTDLTVMQYFMIGFCLATQYIRPED